jgi:two-component system chemotaxis response regulator CheB
MSATRTRVLVCGDSALQRTLEFDHTLQVVGVRTTAASALAAITELRPDLVTLDVELPALGGIKAIEDIMSSTPVPILVFTAQVARDGALALSAGALDAFAKGDLDLRDPAGLAAEALRRRVQLLSQVRVIRHPRARLRRNGAAQRPVASRRLEAIGIVSSTGGPQALSVVLGALPADFPVPLLVVQHMTRGFTAGFVAWLDTVVPPAVRLAADGLRLAPGVWIAPEGAHLVVGSDRCFALDRRLPGVHRPSGDVLLRSLAERYGAAAAAVILSGMGADGAAGVKALTAAGGVALAQDEATSAIYGMPRAAAELGASSLPLEELGPALLALVGKRP